MKKVITAKVCAKVNLSLVIDGIKDGMHLLDSLMHTVSLFDTVTMTVGDTGVYMGGRLSNNNIVCKVQDEARKLGLPDVRFDIKKGIPFSAGLGGSSADAAAAVKLINREFGVALNPIAFGSDVPFMVDGGFARVRGVGERIDRLNPLKLNLVIAKGEGGVSTKEAYQTYDKVGGRGTTDTDMVINAFNSKERSALNGLLHNDLQYSAELLNPEIENTVGLIRNFTPYVLMSGSGSAVFGVFDSESEAKRAEKELSDKVKFVKAVQTTDFGVKNL